MYGIILVMHVIIAILLIGAVLIQHGKGAQMGAAFGSGASQTVFGSQGSGGFLTRATWLLAGLFFVTSIILAYLINKATYQNVTPIIPSSTINQAHDEQKSATTMPSQTNGSPSSHVGDDIPEVP